MFKIRAMLLTLEQVNPEWSGLFNCWVDKFGVQRMYVEYSLKGDDINAPSRIHHERDICSDNLDYDKWLEIFVLECVAGLEEEYLANLRRIEDEARKV